MLGCGFPEQKQGMNLARRAALLAGLPASVPGRPSTASAPPRLQTIRMAFHAIRAGEGDAFVAGGRRVDHAGRRLPEGRRGAAPEAVRRRRADRERLHPDGHDRRERRRALGRLARGHGPLRAALAGAGGGGAGQRVLRPRAHSLERRVRRRRAAPRLDAREARRARAGLPARRQGDGRELVPAERRRGGGRRHERRRRRRSSVSSRGRGSSRRRSRASSRRSWASARSAPCATCWSRRG